MSIATGGSRAPRAGWTGDGTSKPGRRGAGSRGFLAGLVCSALLSGCAEPVEEHRESHPDGDGPLDSISLSPEGYQAAGIVVEAVGSRSEVPTIRVTGTLSYDERKMAIATARIGGRIAEVIGDFGQDVARGEPLAWIDSPELGAAQAEYLRAQSMSRLRQAEYERAQLLLEGEAISRGELLRREVEWFAAKAELGTAEQQLHLLGLSQEDIDGLSSERGGRGHQYPVRAAISGRVTERKAIQGRVVSPDDELFTVARLESLWLFLQIFEKDLPAVREGTRVTLTCESHPDHRYAGTIDFVGQVLDPHSRTGKARAVIENPDGKLKPGMFVYATLETPETTERDPDEIWIPIAAVSRMEGRDMVFVRTGDRTFEPREVILGPAGRDSVKVRSGLKAGEEIVVDGVFTLKSEALGGDLEEHHH